MLPMLSTNGPREKFNGAYPLDGANNFEVIFTENKQSESGDINQSLEILIIV